MCRARPGLRRHRPRSPPDSSSPGWQFLALAPPQQELKRAPIRPALTGTAIVRGRNCRPNRGPHSPPADRSCRVPLSGSEYSMGPGRFESGVRLSVFLGVQDGARHTDCRAWALGPPDRSPGGQGLPMHRSAVLGSSAADWLTHTTPDRSRPRPRQKECVATWTSNPQRNSRRQLIHTGGLAWIWPRPPADALRAFSRSGGADDEPTLFVGCSGRND